MQETEIDYISPDQPISTSGISPLAKLQETCRNIGSDLPAQAREPTYKSRHSSRNYLSMSKHPKDKMKKVSSPPQRIDKTNHTPAAYIPTTLNTSPLPPASAAADYSQFAASQYQLMCQKLVYQKELEKLQMSLNNPYVPTSTNFSTANPIAMTQPVTNSFNPTEFAKLAAYFYNKFEQTSSLNTNPLTGTTEALQNYRKMFLESTNGKFMAPELKTSPPSPQLHECHWVTPNGICGKKHYSYDDLMLHLRSHASSSSDSLPAPLPPADSLPAMNSRLISNLPNIFNPNEFQYNPILDTVLSKNVSKPFSHHAHTRFQPYSLPTRQLSVPFLH